MNSEVNIHIFNECSGSHSHVYPQILVPLQETMKIQVGDTDYEVTPQELCFVPAGMVHQCNYIGRLLVLDLSEGMSENPDAVLLSYPLIVSMRGQIMQLVELIPSGTEAEPGQPFGTLPVPLSVQQADRELRRAIHPVYQRILPPADHGRRAGPDREL